MYKAVRYLNIKTEQLKKSILEMIQNTTPVNGKNGSLFVENLDFDIPDADDSRAILDLKYNKSGSMEGHVSGEIVIKNSAGKVISSSGKIKKLIPFPIATERGTYVVNGSEKYILNQARLNPGVYTKKDQGEITTEIKVDNSKTPEAGKYVPPIKISYNEENGDFSVSINKKSGGNGISFLRNMGFSDPEIARMLGNGAISDSAFGRYGNKGGADISKIYTLLVGRSPQTVSSDKIRAELYDFLQNNGGFGWAQRQPSLPLEIPL